MKVPSRTELTMVSPFPALSCVVNDRRRGCFTPSTTPSIQAPNKTTKEMSEHQVKLYCRWIRYLAEKIISQKGGDKFQQTMQHMETMAKEPRIPAVPTIQISPKFSRRITSENVRNQLGMFDDFAQTDRSVAFTHRRHTTAAVAAAAAFCILHRHYDCHKRQEGTRRAWPAVRQLFLVRVENVYGDSMVVGTNSGESGGKSVKLVGLWETVTLCHTLLALELAELHPQSESRKFFKDRVDKQQKTISIQYHDDTLKTWT
ncbi:hypothetical protein EYF80_012408 [Liparis tanakae]|uniref:Uncharacterized protein n=1 Tax=Liparis tanakae TaxID=230148 RepID=A0A4Z2IIN0_9TELE|nr:hypothetical protein EYF80_012408 [Liparis tanakae]